MLQVQVIGSSRASAGVPATIRRVRDALTSAGVPLAPPGTVTAADALQLVVDPAVWYAERPVPPTAAVLARTVGYSLAAYGTPSMQDDAAVGRVLAAIAHPDPRSATHLRRLGCDAEHVPLGCRPAAAAPETGPRPLELLSFGPSTPRRLRILAYGAPWFDEVRCAHRFDEELPAAPGSADGDPFTCALVLMDVAPDDDAAPDAALLLAAVEAGTAVVTERLGELPEGPGANAFLRAPSHTLPARARELCSDPVRARALAAAARTAWAQAHPLADMGLALAALLEGLTASDRQSAAATAPPVVLTHHAAPQPAPASVAQTLKRERERPDAALRHGLQGALTRMRAMEERLDRLEHGAEAGEVDVLLRPPGARPPRVSVLIPCFRARGTVLEALASVRAVAASPGAPSLEVVAVDDGSPAGDGVAVAAWASEHPDLPVTVLRHRANRGLAAARNTAMAYAKGEYVLPLDADNVLRPQGPGRLLEALEARPDAGFAYGILQEFSAEGPVGLRGLYPWEPSRLRYGNYIDALALVRRALLDELGGYTEGMPEQGYEDWDLWCRCAEQDVPGVWVPEMVASYRLRPSSMSEGLHLSHVAPLADMIERHPELLA